MGVKWFSCKQSGITLPILTIICERCKIKTVASDV